MQRSLLIGFLCLFLVLVWRCSGDVPQNIVLDSSLPYLNLHDTVSYVGMETCRACHANKFETFQHTGMGLSFDVATHSKSAARFDKHTVVYDSINQFYYHPFWRNDSLFIQEYRVEKGDTTHQFTQYIRYIIGSGQHTNSHIYEENGYLYQAPITFYTQKGIWDLAPGFGSGFSSRFQRIIGQECMSCHNGKSNFVSESENKFLKVAHGIDCERCHGAGGEHIRRKLAGEVIDTALHTDYSIVNPRRLPSRDYQMSVCQRCHLQGIAVLKKETDDFYTFRPGRLLSDVMDVYLPEYDGNQTQFIMASQAHRLTKSQCYQKSEMNCWTCHNPHVSVRQTPAEHFNATCQKCHQQKTCSLSEQQRQKQNKNNCYACHLPPSPSIDIPHVTVHDHYIRRPIPEQEKKKVEKFIGLVAANNPRPSALSRAQGYLHYFESYTSGKNKNLLDSAQYYLNAATQKYAPHQLLDATIHLYYLQENYEKIIATINKIAPQNVQKAWTAYRIGEAFWQQKNIAQAESFFARANQLLPLQSDFQNKLAACYMANSQWQKAEQLLNQLLKETPKHVSALTNLGFVYVNIGNLSRAEQYYQKALALDPDYTAALMNYAALLLLQQDKAKARQLLGKVLQKQPNNDQAKAILLQLNR